MKSDSRAAIVAALVWNRPAMSTMDTPGTKAFVRAMTRDLSLEASQDQLEDADALTLAAVGLVRALRDEREAALPLFERLAAGRSLTSFLGLNLLAWVSDDPTPALERAARVIGRQKDRSLQARLWCKLTTISLDKGKRDLAWSFIMRAKNATPPSSRLGLFIRITAANEFRAFSDEIRPTRDIDYLADLPWISQAAEEAGREALAEAVLSAGGRTGTKTIHFGLTLLDKITAAEMQATWAGALWLRRPLRLQLAATLLSGGAVSPNQWPYACAMWVLGHGKNVVQVIDAAERHFDNKAGDSLINNHLRHFGSGVWESHTRSQVLGAVWDLISPETAEGLVRTLSVPTSRDPFANEQLQLLGALSLRAPDAWSERFGEMSQEERLAMAIAMAPDVLELLPQDIASALLELLVAEADTGEANEDYFLSLAALLSRVDRTKENTKRLMLAPPSVIPEMVLRYPGVVPPEAAPIALQKLRAQVVDELKGAEQGKWSIGGRSARRGLGALAGQSANDQERSQSIGTLLRVVMSHRAPRDMRIEAAIGLWPTSEKHGLTRVVRTQLRKADTSTSTWDFPGFVAPKELLEVAILGALAPSGLGQHERDLLIVRSRDADPLVRGTAIHSAAMTADNSVKEIAILAGLFDPSEDVQIATLEALGKEYARSGKSLRLPGVYERLRTLFSSGGRDVRARIVQTSRVLASARVHLPPLEEILKEAATDRSWIVREVAERAPLRRGSGRALTL